MEVMFIGDVHGLSVWKTAVFGKDPDTGIESSKTIEDFDKVIFTGDYVDSFIASDEDVIKNLEEIIQLKKDNMDKVVLLYGNHDAAYITDRYCSGMRSQMTAWIKKTFEENKDMFRLAWGHRDVLVTHAGVVKPWLTKVFGYKGDYSDAVSIADALNEAWDTMDPGVAANTCLFDVSWYRGGRDIIGGLLWADSKEFTPSGNLVPKLRQVAGHNRFSKITKVCNGDGASMTFIDVMENVWVDLYKRKQMALMGPGEETHLRAVKNYKDKTYHKMTIKK